MMDGNESAAWGKKVCRAQVIPAYPITPQTDLINHIATLIAEGHMKLEYLKVMLKSKQKPVEEYLKLHNRFSTSQ